MADQLSHEGEARSVEDSERELGEARVALLSVLQELTVAAMDLFDPQQSSDRFMDRVAERLDCIAAIWLVRNPQGLLQLAGAAGLSRASRELQLGWMAESLSTNSVEVFLPYPEVAAPGIHRWLFPLPGASSALLLFFEREPHHPRLYCGMVKRLVAVLSKVVEHRQLFALEQDARVQAEEAVHLRDEFLSVASHELKTPVTSLQLVVQRALRLGKDGETIAVPADALRRTFENIQRQTRRLGKLVNAMLDVSRIHAGKVELEFERVDLSEIVWRVVNRFEEEIRRSGSELTVKADSPTWGWLDRSRVDQVVTNLLSNALKYGEGKPVEIQVKALDGKARLSVRDQGIGIPADRREKIFEPFERAVSTRSYGGLGLGLHIVATILEMLHGNIRLESEPGRGTTFIVELPLSTAK